MEMETCNRDQLEKNSLIAKVTEEICARSKPDEYVTEQGLAVRTRNMQKWYAHSPPSQLSCKDTLLEDD